jgi:tetratricopeptide (TPR) repeat protein
MAIGKQALEHEQWDAAQTFFANYVRDNPQSVEAKFYLASAEQGGKHYDEAEKLYKQIIAQYPKIWSSYSNLSEVYAAQERWPEFEQERALLHQARANNEPGTQNMGHDVIDVLYVGDQRYIVREYYPLDGRFHTRYNFTHFTKDGKLDFWIACESDDIDQVDFAKRHPQKAAAGERSFSLDSYTNTFNAGGQRTGQTHGTIMFYSEGEPDYPRVRADVLRVLTGKASPMSTTTINGLEVPQRPDVPKQTPAAPK